LLKYLRIARPAVGSGGPGLGTSTTGQSGAENTFALSVARLVESLPLSTPPGATSRILPGPIIAAGFAPASVGVHRIEVAYYISSGNAGEFAFAQICLKLGAHWS